MTTNLDDIRSTMRAHYLADEGGILPGLVDGTELSAADREAVCKRAADLVRAVRSATAPSMMESFLAEYGLSTGEGVALMCLAEALLRVPDSETMDDLIADKIAPHDWSNHSGQSSSIMVNASTWGLMLTGRVLEEEEEGGIEGTLRALVKRMGEPVIRRAVAAAMREMGQQFVLGRSIDEAFKRGRESTAKGYVYSYDMLGEAARTEADALRYHRAYSDAITAISRLSNKDDIRANPGISVKLSALHPRYETTHRETMLPVMRARLLELAQAAKQGGMGLNIDAEEADRLDLSLDVIGAVLADESLAGWGGFGIVVQAYCQRAPMVLDWLYALAQKFDRKIMVRLVKGAYWDTEIKRAQVMGLDGFPVFTRKAATDVSYLACARKLFSMTDRIYPQFATHNAHTAAAILAMAPNKECFEFQRLHGMGEALHEAVRKAEGTRCRIYAPVGQHADLLAYLVRRLLENGANSSFVHQIVDKAVRPEEIARDPIADVLAHPDATNPAIRKARALFEPERSNSRGWDITDPEDLARIETGRAAFAAPHQWRALPMLAGGKTTPSGAEVKSVNPADPNDIVGVWHEATAQDVAQAVETAREARPAWAALPVTERAAIVDRIADLYEENAIEFFALAGREAGKIINDGIAEVREAVDFLRYYASRAGTVERGTEARGVIACISPWNFPLAIFTGQIAAALVTGNAVLAKPAEQTPLIAARAVELMRQAGVPDAIIQLLPGDGATVGAALTASPHIAGVCFTGSTEVARLIERQLAETATPDAMLIAETGGLNAMIVDSTALPEQAVRDIVASAFQSAGQRCSALRVLYVQEDIADKLLAMLKGAMDTLDVGDPWRVSTDTGPLIDAEAQDLIGAYCQAMTDKGRLIARLEAPQAGRFVGPHIFQVSGIGELEREVFGPVLHVATFKAEEIDSVIAAINAKGYGLTFGLHTRIDARVQYIVDGIHAGNLYVNRNQIGAVVGSQPFGGEGLSGTGPKAGGPLYLRRFRKAQPVGYVQTDNHVAADPAELAAALAAGPGDWALRGDRVGELRKLLRGRAAEALGAAAAIDQGPIDLPGPTGESNVLNLAPRGRVLCMGRDAAAVLDQVVQALAMGNAVVGAAPGATAALAPLIGKGLPVTAIEGTVNPVTLESADLDAVALAADADTTRDVRRALARRTGRIVPLIVEPVYPAAYAHERSVCVDTTAAGGNASLLAAAG